MPRLSALILALILAQNANAQTHSLDSLRNKLYLAQTASEKLDILLALGRSQHSLNRDSAYLYTGQALPLAAKSSARNKTLAALYFAQSYIPWGWIDSSLAVLEPILPLVKPDYPSTRDLYFQVYRQKAMCYGLITRYKEALEILYRLIDETQQYNDSVAAGANFNSIGSIAIARDRPKEALNWCYKALSFSTDNRNYLPVRAAIYINLANAWVMLDHSDSALLYLEKAMPIANDIENLHLLGVALRVRANALVKSGDLGATEATIKQMQSVKSKMNATNITDDNLAIIDFYINVKQFDRAIEFTSSLLEHTRETKDTAGVNYTSVASLRLLYYDALAKCYRLAGKTGEYQQTLEKIIKVKDSVYAATSEKEIADIQTKYDTQLKENVIIQQQGFDIVRKNYLFYGLLCLSVLAAIAGYFVLRANRKKQQLKMETALKEEKRLADEAIKKAAEKERVRIAADLHDNLGAYAASMSSNLHYLHIDESNASVKNALNELKNNSGAIISELNDTIWVLKKDSLSLTAICDRVKVFVGRIRKSYPHIDIDIIEKIDQDVLFTSSQAFHLYRIIQESLNNALRHSHASLIFIEFMASENWQVVLADNGKGMGIIKEGNGLNNMKARAGENGWSIRWTAVETGGTTVAVSPTQN